MKARKKVEPMARKMTNPFKPTAGAEPPVLAGRDKVIEDFVDGLDEGSGAPGRLMRITGPRGSGKTVLLTELGDIARKRGWLVVDVTAQGGLCDMLVEKLRTGNIDLDASVDVDLGVLKAHAGTSSASGEEGRGFRETLTAAASRPGVKGVMVTIDEVQSADLKDMTDIATSVQHLIRERKNVAFVFAGITTGVLDFLNDSALTFLRRAKAEELASIPDDEVSRALSESFEDTGLRIEGECLDAATQATSGYAFMIQLVGYHIWRMARKHAETSIDVAREDVAEGVRKASEEYDEAVVAPALAGLSQRAVSYLLAMAEIGESASAKEISEKLGIPSTSLSSARRALLSRQVIEAPARGRVRFSIPRLREYLTANADELRSRFE